jgi:hypothetical protein
VLQAIGSLTSRYLSFFKLALMVSIVCALFFACICMAFALSVVEYCSDEEHED